MKNLTREEALRIELRRYDDYEAAIKRYNSGDMKVAVKAGVELADNYPKENIITMSQFDELMDALYDYLYEHNRNILKRKDGVNCTVNVREIKTIVDEHKTLHWK